MASEVIINGDIYSVMPGTYRKFSNSEDSPPTGVWIQRDFVGGEGRAIQLEQDRGWLGLRVGPSQFGQGVEPWPYRTTFADGNIATATTTRIPNLVAEGYVWMAIGRYLYRSVSIPTTTWAAWTQVYDAGAGVTISAIAAVGGKIITCNGTGVDMNAHTPGGGNAAFTAGAKGWRAVGYAGHLIWADAADPRVIRFGVAGTTIDSRTLDSPVSLMCLHAGRVAIATQTSIYLLGGRSQTVGGVTSWLGEPEPVATLGTPTDNDTADLRFLQSFAGKLYTWLGGQVQEWGASSTNPAWKPVGLEGRNCYGAAVVGSCLVVSMATRAGMYEVWCYDTVGWWRIHAHASQARVWPCALQGAGNLDMILFRAGSGTGQTDLFRTQYRTSVAHNYPTDDGGGEYITSLIDAGRPDVLKHWTSVGVTWATPDERGNPGSSDLVTVNIYYSLDAGRTWTLTNTGSRSMSSDRAEGFAGGLGPLAPSTADIPASRYLQLKIEWQSVDDWAPALTSIWAEWVLIDHHEVRWTMDIRAVDRAVQEDGSVDPRTGDDISADLWAAWYLSEPISFYDVGENHSSSKRDNAIIMRLSEKISSTDTATKHRDSVFSVEILEL